MVLDGSERVDSILKVAMPWDVYGGVARRSWARNENAIATSIGYNLKGKGHVTVPRLADDELLDRILGVRDGQDS